MQMYTPWKPGASTREAGEEALPRSVGLFTECSATCCRGQRRKPLGQRLR